tara:strand:+ start:8836 stop:9093 length:258 start_codon:yes stop_codon:yes gene_type:complete
MPEIPNKARVESTYGNKNWDESTNNWEASMENWEVGIGLINMYAIKQVQSILRAPTPTVTRLSIPSLPSTRSELTNPNKVTMTSI